MVAVGLLVGSLVPVPYVVLSPGPVINVLGSPGGKPLITISGAKTFPTTGQLDLTTVSEAGGPYGRVPLPRVLRGWLDPTVAVVPTDLLYPPGTSSAQVQQQNTEEMLQSQDSAVVAALRHLRLPVTLEVFVAAVEPGSPSAGHLLAGDRVSAVDGRQVGTGDQVRAQIHRHRPGQSVVLTVVRAGHARRIRLVTAATPGDPTAAMVGFTPRDAYTSPVKVHIQLADVGGPSAGLMFTIGIIDMLTPVQENGGDHVAGTGTIDANGTVGDIGGIRQKMAGARDDGATIFLVPAGNCAEALLGAPAGLRLVKVTTVDDALSGLAAAVAGRPAPSCAPS